MEAFGLESLSPELRESYEQMYAGGVNILPCLHCREAVTFNEFSQFAESGRYDHTQLVEILKSGTHPECWKQIFCEEEE